MAKEPKNTPPTPPPPPAPITPEDRAAVAAANILRDNATRALQSKHLADRKLALLAKRNPAVRALLNPANGPGPAALADLKAKLDEAATLNAALEVENEALRTENAALRAAAGAAAPGEANTPELPGIK
jgi:hypothetical protein